MRILFFSVIVLFINHFGYTQNWYESKKIAANDRNTEEWFAFSVANSGDFIISGAIYEDADANGANILLNPGAAYIIQRNAFAGWSQHQKISASDRYGEDLFGCAVAIDGNYAVIGAFQQDKDHIGAQHMSNAGAVYIFERDVLTEQWIEVQKITASDRNADDWFGLAVAISGNYLVVGSINQDFDHVGSTNITNAGAAYVFQRNATGNWLEVQKLTAVDRQADDWFGGSVAIDDDKILIGSVHDDEDSMGNNPAPNAGSAYIYEIDSTQVWTLKQKITTSDRAPDDFFGKSVSISGNTLLVGAYGEDHDPTGFAVKTGAGSAYIFERDQNNNWIEVQKIVASDREAKDQFGWSVAIQKNIAIVGARFEDQDVTGGATQYESGAAYIFERDPSGYWNDVQKVVASDRDDFDQFSYAVSLDSTCIIVGSYREDHDASGNFYFERSGSLYVFEHSSGVNISEYDSTNDLVIYPNPARSSITLNFQVVPENLIVQVCDILGRPLSTYTVDHQEIQIDMPPLPGIYIIQVFRSLDRIHSTRILKY